MIKLRTTEELAIVIVTAAAAAAPNAVTSVIVASLSPAGFVMFSGMIVLANCASNRQLAPIHDVDLHVRACA